MSPALQFRDIVADEVKFVDESKDRVKQLEAENAQLKNQLALTNADLVAFMDFYFSNTTTA